MVQDSLRVLLSKSSMAAMVVVGWLAFSPGVSALWAADVESQSTAGNSADAAGKRTAGNNTGADASSAVQLLQAAYQQSRTAESIEQLTQVLAACQQGLAASPTEAQREYARSLMVWTFNKRGELHAAADNEAAALADFSRAVQLDATAWRALHNRGVSYAMLGDASRAKADFDRVLQLKPEFATAWFNRGEWHYEQGDYQQAVSDYSRSLAIKTDDAHALMSRGHARHKLGEDRAALADLNRAITLAPDMANAYVYRAALAVDQRRYAEAADDYRQAIRLDPEYGAAYQAVAWLLATCGDASFRDPILALQTAKRAIALDGSSDYHYLETLAAAHAANGQFDEAVAAQKQAIAAITGQPAEVLGLLRGRLQLYQQRQPYYENRAMPTQTATRNTPSTVAPATTNDASDSPRNGGGLLRRRR